jgi:hypothetical protein
VECSFSVKKTQRLQATANAVANDRSFNIFYTESMQVAHDLVAEATSLPHNPFESGGGQIFRLIIRDAVSRT